MDALDRFVNAYVRLRIPHAIVEPSSQHVQEATVSYVHELLGPVCGGLGLLVVAVDGASCCEGFSNDQTRRIGSCVAAAHRVVYPKDETIGSLKEENARLKRELETLKRAESRRPLY